MSSVTYATELMAAVAELYRREIQTDLVIAYLGLHTTSDDGWTTQETGGDPVDLLMEFQSAWSGGWPAPAELAHFLSGASLHCHTRLS